MADWTDDQLIRAIREWTTRPILVLSARSQDYVEAVRALGAPTTRILLRTVLQGLLAMTLVYALMSWIQPFSPISFCTAAFCAVREPGPSSGTSVIIRLSMTPATKSLSGARPINESSLFKKPKSNGAL